MHLDRRPRIEFARLSAPTPPPPPPRLSPLHGDAAPRRSSATWPGPTHSRVSRLQVMVSDIDASAGASAVSQLQQDGIHAAFVACDVTSKQQVDALVQSTVERMGGLDILVANAGAVAAAAVVVVVRGDRCLPAPWLRLLGVPNTTTGVRLTPAGPGRRHRQGRALPRDERGRLRCGHQSQPQGAAVTHILARRTAPVSCNAAAHRPHTASPPPPSSLPPPFTPCVAPPPP